MLDGLPECADHGWLALHEGSYVMNVRDDLDGAAELAQRAATLGRKLGVPDLEAIGLALEGIALVRRSNIEAGMRLLEEAAVSGASEELQSPLSRRCALCYLILGLRVRGDMRAVAGSSHGPGRGRRPGYMRPFTAAPGPRARWPSTRVTTRRARSDGHRARRSAEPFARSDGHGLPHYARR